MKVKRDVAFSPVACSASSCRTNRSAATSAPSLARAEKCSSVLPNSSRMRSVGAASLMVRAAAAIDRAFLLACADRMASATAVGLRLGQRALRPDHECAKQAVGHGLLLAGGGGENEAILSTQ